MQSPCKRIKNSEEAWSTLLPTHWCLPLPLPKRRGGCSHRSARKTKVKQHPTMTRGSGANPTTKRPHWSQTRCWVSQASSCGMRTVDKVRLSYGRNESRLEVAKLPWIWERKTPVFQSLDQEVEEERVREPTRHRFKKWKRKRMAWFLPLSNSMLPTGQAACQEWATDVQQDLRPPSLWGCWRSRTGHFWPWAALFGALQRVAKMTEICRDIPSCL